MIIRNIILITFLSISHMTTRAADIDAELDWADYQHYGFAVNGIVDDTVIDVGARVNKEDVLARLLQQPFNVAVEQCRAAVNKLEPSIKDAKRELDHANELFERTVLSEVELQVIDGKYKALKAEKKEREAAC